MTVLDPATQSNYIEVTTKHVHFDWTIDWKQRIIVGSATHDLVANQDGVKRVVFDTSYLEIHGAEVAGASVEYELKQRHPVMGNALEISLPSPLQKGDQIVLRISYSTTNQCTAVGWLDKEQTSGKQFDYLFSQCQPIHARSLAPLQDSSSVKITYSADVTSVLPVLMSALRLSPPTDGPAHQGKEVGVELVRYQYNQPIAIPSYLIAIASGNVIYKPFAPVPGRQWKTGVWTEPEQMDAAFWEFSEDTSRYVLQAEEILTPYEFGVYDLLLLPPSFPYGGMENACLTFVTPTLLTGDRSLVDVVAHEISHSWFGNNVSCADSGHFWLNEGWTTYTERLLKGMLHTPAERDFSYIIGEKALIDALEHYKDRPRFQRLVIDYAYGEDPDDAYSRVPYDKGSNFLLYLERLLGGLDVFLPYARDYINTFRGQSIRTDEWKAHLYAYFEKHGGEDKLKVLNSVDWQEWLHGEGTKLPVKIEYDTKLAERSYQLAAKWNDSRTIDPGNLPFSAKDLHEFSSNQTVVFLERLQRYDPLPAPHIKSLGEIYSLDTTMNSEIRLRWYELALSAQEPAPLAWSTRAAEWVVGGGKGVDAGRGVKGRMKFCRPTFRAIYKVDPTLAKSSFEAHKAEFHPIARRMIAKIELYYQPPGAPTLCHQFICDAVSDLGAMLRGEEPTSSASRNEDFAPLGGEISKFIYLSLFAYHTEVSKAVNYLGAQPLAYSRRIQVVPASEEVGASPTQADDVTGKIFRLEQSFKSWIANEVQQATLVQADGHPVAAPSLIIEDAFNGGISLTCKDVHEVPVVAWWLMPASALMILTEHTRNENATGILKDLARLHTEDTENLFVKAGELYLRNVSDRLLCVPGLPAMHEWELQPHYLPFVPLFMVSLISRIANLMKHADILACGTTFEMEPIAAASLSTAFSNPIKPFFVGPPVDLVSTHELDPASSITQFLDKAYSEKGANSVAGFRLVFAISSENAKLYKSWIDQHIETGNAIFPEWTNQTAVLEHPAIHYFLSHGGWNSTTEALVRGVPMIFWPVSADQPMNAIQIADTHDCGFELLQVRDGPAKSTAYRRDTRIEIVGTDEAVREEMRKVMELSKGPRGHHQRRNIRALGQVISRSLAPGGSADVGLEEFGKSLGLAIRD
ncbi:Leukotriene A4 hydrolase, C-terminal, partial [Rhizoctonia solani]